MALSEKLLDMIVCPQCKGKLEYLEKEEKLICQACRLSYRVSDDIPVLLVEEAEKI
ncbi:MAG: Trm112 family protein [candidate division Zixibacteria bacterium]|nr:Trm112 family protein [candidate division Zixibacteria bacterium]